MVNFIPSTLKVSFLSFFQSSFGHSSFSIFLYKFNNPTTTLKTKDFSFCFPQLQWFFSCALGMTELTVLQEGGTQLVLSAFSRVVVTPLQQACATEGSFLQSSTTNGTFLTTQWKVCEVESGNRCKLFLCEHSWGLQMLTIDHSQPSGNNQQILAEFFLLIFRVALSSAHALPQSSQCFCSLSLKVPVFI